MTDISKNKRNNAAAYVYAVITTIIWGSIYITNRVALQSITSYELAFFRFFLSIIFLFIILKIKKASFHIEKADWKHIAVIGFLSYFLNIECILIGVKYAGSTLSALLASMTPVVIVLFAAILLKEKLTVRKTICLVASLAGALIITFGDTSGAKLIGILGCVGSVISFGLGSVYMRRIAQKYDPVVISFWSMVVALPPLAIVAGISYTSTGPFEISGELIGCVCYSAIIGTGVAQTLWNMALSRIEANTCTIFYPLQPLTAAVLGVLLLDEDISAKTIIGAVFIMGSIIGCFIKINKKQK